MKKILLVLLAVLTLFSSVAMASCQDAGSTEEFNFYEFSDYYGVSLNNLNSEVVTIPSEHNGKPVLSIMDDGFKNSKVVSVTIPDNIMLIGKNAFLNCTDLTTVKISNNSKLDRIKEYAFANCDKLASFNITPKVKFIEKNAFYSCDILSNIDLSTVSGYTGNGNNRTESIIDDYAFAYCPKLSEVNVKAFNLGNNVFYGSGVKKVTLGSEILSIGLSVLKDCNALQELTVGFIGGKKTGQDFLAYLFGASIYNVGELYTPSSLKKVTVNGGRVVGSNAFYNLKIEEVVLSNSITKIEPYAFTGCNNLSKVSLVGSWQTSLTSTSGETEIDTSDITLNATNLVGEHSNKYWIKNI